MLKHILVGAVASGLILSTPVVIAAGQDQADQTMSGQSGMQQEKNMKQDGREKVREDRKKMHEDREKMREERKEERKV